MIFTHIIFCWNLLNNSSNPRILVAGFRGFEASVSSVLGGIQNADFLQASEFVFRLDIFDRRVVVAMCEQCCTCGHSCFLIF